MQFRLQLASAAARAALPSLALAALCASAAAMAEDCRHDIPPSTPSAAFIDHGDGTATHAATGLMWKRCSEGQAWSGTGCEGEASTHAWGEALELATASVYAGHGDWRLPNVKELVRLVEQCRILPAINAEVFPATPGGRFWSGTPSAETVGTAWHVDFEFGPAHGSGYRSEALHVRLVREATLAPPAETEGESVKDADQAAGQRGPESAVGTVVDP
jgi:hypothetical protein